MTDESRQEESREELEFDDSVYDDLEDNATNIHARKAHKGSKPMTKGKSPGRPKGVRNLASKSHVRFTATKQREFLKHLERTGNISSASAAIGVTRQTVYNAIRGNERFASRVEIAKARSLGSLEDLAYKRIYQGTSTTVYDSEGEVVTRTVKDDNTLLTRMLEAGDPDKYGKTTNNKSVNVNVDVAGSTASKLSQLLGMDVQPEDFRKEKDISGESERV